jgi:hypothetical protein
MPIRRGLDTFGQEWQQELRKVKGPANISFRLIELLLVTYGFIVHTRERSCPIASHSHPP